MPYNICIYICKYVYEHIHICMCTYTYIHIHIHTSNYEDMYVWTYVCTYVYIYPPTCCLILSKFFIIVCWCCRCIRPITWHFSKKSQLATKCILNNSQPATKRTKNTCQLAAKCIKNACIADFENGKKIYLLLVTHLPQHLTILEKLATSYTCTTSFN